MRQFTYKEAIQEATISVMQRDPSVILMGLGVPDPKGIFGTTIRLRQIWRRSCDGDTNCRKWDDRRSHRCRVNGHETDSYPSESGICTLAIEQIINQAAKWSYMTDGKASVPIVIRLIVGRGWGAGASTFSIS